jgi:PAS domain S-box-containing protein
MKQSLERRIILFSFITLSMTMLASTATEIAVVRKDYTKEIQLRSQSLGISLKNSLEKVLALGIAITDVSGLEEKCREVILPDPDMKYCVITDANGNVLFSSDKKISDILFSKQRPAKKLSSDHDSISAQIDSDDGIFFESRTLVRSYDLNTVAYVHVGFSQDVVDKKINNIIVRSVAVFMVFFSISFALVVLFAKRSIVAPIAKLLSGVTLIARGKYSSLIKPLPVLEFDELASNINDMAASLEARDKELRNNYDELSSTHKHLQSSYLQLEALSLELEKSEELFRKILEESGDAIIILDESEHVMISNRRASELLGPTPEELYSQHISTVLLSIEAGNIPHILKSINMAYEGLMFSEEIVFANNQQQRVGKLDTSQIAIGEKKLLQLIIRDVTREREILANLEQSAAGLAKLNKMKDSFLGLASHELKTPLTIILGYSELLQSDAKERLSETTREMITNISNAAIRLDGIVKDMIDVSMIDQNQMGLKRTRLDINALLESTIREMRFFLATRNQEIVTSLDPALPMLTGDQTRLIQMFTNVIGNAIKFTPDGGKITVSTARINILSNESAGDWGESNLIKAGICYQEAIEISVKDRGIGIDSEDQTRIFEKFFEAGNIEEHSSGKVAFNSRGAGLGLSIAKGVAEIHGGRIWVESPGYNPDTFPGSTFFIVLPLDSASNVDKLL